MDVRACRLAFLVLFAASLPASAQYFGVRGRAWWADPDGEIEFQDAPPDATDTDINSELGLGDPKIFWNVTGYIALPGAPWRVSADYLQGSFDESATLPKSVTFDKTVFPAGSRVGTTVDVKRFELFIDQQVMPVGQGGGLYSSLGFIWAGIGAELDGPGGSPRDEAKGIFPIAGFHADVPIAGFLRGIGRIAYTQMKIGDNSINNFELEGGLGVFFGDHLAIEGGYRLWRIDLQSGDGGNQERADLILSGPFAGVTILF